ncbi:hypothetical protein [Nocardia sp. SSK8]|uniref:hypothetical protein n=1 Tax=Nocardia sp. SSK8 TaxID=3120154 RepID=UPI00300B9941
MLPSAVAAISTVAVLAIGLLGAPTTILFVALPLHILAVVIPPLLALRRLRRGLWPMDAWYRASDGIRAQAWILVIESALAGFLGYRGWPVLPVLAVLAFIVRRVSLFLAGKAGIAIHPVDALYRAESDDEIDLYADGGYDNNNLLVLVRVYLAADRISLRSWTKRPERPTRLNAQAYYVGVEDETTLLELPFDRIRDVTLWTFPPGYTQHRWFITPDGKPLYNNKISTAILLSTTDPNLPVFTIPTPDAAVLTEVVRRRIHHYHRR